MVEVLGGKMNKAYWVVGEFEEAMAEFCGSKYAISVESCSAAIFLCCLYVKVKDISEIIIPKFTYPSVPCSIINGGGRLGFRDIEWQFQGYYQLFPTNIIDSAKRIARGKYIEGSLTCLSFHSKKVLPIGRGGMILTDDKEAVDYLKWMRFDGRGEYPLKNDVLHGVGFNMYLQPEQAARGLELMQFLKDENISPPDEYQDLSRYSFYTEANRV